MVKKIRYEKGLIVLIIFFILIVILCGLFTDLRFSDEIYHFWFAKDWYSANERPVYSEFLHTVPEFGYYHYYLSVPLWHYGLKTIFELSGSASKNLAQVYMALWYSLLIFGTYLLGKTVYNKESGLYSAFIIASTPFVVSFSILFFIDIPIAAVTPYLIYFVIKRRYVLGGIMMGLMFLLKENSYFLFPAVYILLLFQFYSRGPISLSKRFLQVAVFSILVLAVITPNFKFKLDKFNGLLSPNDEGNLFMTIGQLLETSSLKSFGFAKLEDVEKEKTQPKNINYIVAPLTSFSAFLTYFGILFPFLFLWRIISIFKYKDYDPKENVILIPILIYAPCYLIAFRGWWDIRYLSPIIPLIYIFIVKGVINFKRWGKVTILSVGCLMFISTVTFVYMKRQVTPPEREAINFIKQLPNNRILTPEPLISFYAERPKLWVDSFKYNPSISLYDLFWDDSNIKKEKVLKDYKIKYILIPHERTYDDTKVHHFGGYPKSFVERLPKLSFVKLVFDNKEISIWQVE